MMAVEKVSLYNESTDTLVEVMLSPEDAARVRTDLFFATTVMNAALLQQESEDQVLEPEPRPSSSKSLDAAWLQQESEDEVQEPEPRPSTSKSLDAAWLQQESEDEVREPEPRPSTSKSLDPDPEDGSSLYRWTVGCVLLLLENYRTIEEKFTNGKQSQKKTWEEMATKLKEQGHAVTGPQCAAKLRSLKKTYKSIKDHNGKSGNDRRTWQFYEIMDEIFSKKAWCSPVALASSTGLATNQDGGNASCANVTPTSRASNVTSLLAKRLRQKEEHEEARAKRHRERMEMDAKLLAVLEKLVDQQ